MEIPENIKSVPQGRFPVEPVIVNQNGVEIKYTPDTYKKGKAKGNATLRGNFEQLDHDARIKLIGGDKGLEKLILRELNARAASYVAEATDEGEFSVEDWYNLASGVSVPGETLESLNDSKQEIADEVMSIMMDSMANGGQLSAEQTARVRELAEERKNIEEAIAKREAIGAKRAAARKANEVKKANNATPVAAVA